MRRRALGMLLPLLIGLVVSCGDDDDANQPNDGAVQPSCSPVYPDIGCFKGAVCASERVGAVCVSGRWTCPAGSAGTESCLEIPSHDAGAAGADASDASLSDAGPSDAGPPDAP
jgi:hypothetical protein